MSTASSPSKRSAVRAPALSDRETLRALGKAGRGECRRADLARLPRAALRRDPVERLIHADRGRLVHLLPIRYGRMAVSPFAFLRGAGAVMAADIGPLPRTGIFTQLCGDCHLGNFGAFASAERTLLFGLNDFDETLPGPFEWDVKRLATSFLVAVRTHGISEPRARDAARAAARSYRLHMTQYARMSASDVWYDSIDVATLVRVAKSASTRRERTKLAVRARTSNSFRTYPKLARVVDGTPRIIDHPPLIYHPADRPHFERDVRHFFARYKQTLAEERRILLDRYELVDVAMKVVGVGSVGTRCAVALLVGSDGEPLLLQLKEARRSVLEPYAGPTRYHNQGLRVVVGQRIMQAATDVFLGFAHSDAMRADFYVRQLRDMKVALDLADLDGRDYLEYADACGWALARSHARAAHPCIIAGYVGASEAFDDAMTSFALHYADQTERDHAKLVKAIRSGRLQAVSVD